VTTVDVVVGSNETPACSPGLLAPITVAPIRTAEPILARRPLLRFVVASAPMVSAAVLALGAAVTVGAPAAVVAALVTAWAVLAPGVRHGMRRPDLSDIVPLCRHSMTTFAAVAVALAWAAAPAELLLGVALILTSATCGFALAVSILGRLVPSRVLLVGEPEALPSAVARIAAGGSGSIVAGALLTGATDGTADCVDGLDGLPVAHDVSAAAELVRRWSVDCVAVVPWPMLEQDDVRRLVWQLERSHVRVVVCMPMLHAMGLPRLSLGRLADAPFAAIASSKVPTSVALVKAAADRLVASVLMLLVAPVITILVALIRLDSPGPAIYRQTRVGQDGRLFTLLKLRTMRMHAENEVADLLDRDEGNGVLFKIHGDPRVTRCGRLLRALSLDELPQLVNVVRGEMSLVGPRPALPCEVEKYDDLARRRLAVRPGMTGLWQVRGRSDLDWEQSVALDAHYVDNVGLTSDLLICLATVRAVVSRKGAY
jgi:exopolysaccharide biosynthesis polyprenyl glycosylphosphotransferase